MAGEASNSSCTVLLIGGPAGDLPNIRGLELEQIPCDVAGIFSRPKRTHFNEYDAVIFWPDKSCFRLPATFEEWELKRACGRLLPIPQEYWLNKDKRENEQSGTKRSHTFKVFDATGAERPPTTEEIFRLTINRWFGSSGVRIPRNSDDCNALADAAVKVCCFFLREVVEGCAQNKVALLIAPPEVPVTCFDWLSRLLVRTRASEVHPQVDTNLPLSPQALHAACFVLEDCNTPWPNTFQIANSHGRRDLGEGEKATSDACPNFMQWGQHWYGLDWKGLPYQGHNLIYQRVLHYFPHVSDAGRGLSVLFQPVKLDLANSPTDSNSRVTGFALIRPEPARLVGLLSGLTQVVAFIRSRAVLPASTESGRERAGQNLEDATKTSPTADAVADAVATKLAPRLDYIEANTVDTKAKLEALEKDPSKAPGRRSADFTHSEDFRSFRFKGKAWPVTAQQAAIVKKLWEAYEAGTPDVSDAMLQDVLGVMNKTSIKDTCRSTPGLLGKVIISKRRGSRRLNLPD